MGFDPYARFYPVANMLGAISQHQKLVSSNLANAHTPGYTTKSASFSDLLYHQDSPFEVPLAKKLGSSLNPLGVTDTGEPVNLQQQMIDMQKNMLFYSIASRRAASIFNSLRTASQIGR
jgi:flagellar basal body rod protein FlgB